MTDKKRSVTFKQADVQRLWNAAKGAGLDIKETRVKADGTIIVTHGGPTQSEHSPVADEWESV